MMPDNQPFHSQVNNKLTFIQEFIKHPFQIGSIIPSSHFLERRIVSAAEIATARVVVELGPGTGGTTRAILRAMPQQATLLSIEINPHFHAIVNDIRDSRLIAHLGSACELEEIIAHYQLTSANAIVSGIPFSTISPSEGAQIMHAVSKVLADNGHFVAYQVSNRVASLCQPFMGSAQVETELLNIPPMRIFLWHKDAN